MTEETDTAKRPAAAEFAERVMIPVEEGWGYIWGKRGQVWTRAEQERADREQTVKYGERWIGKRVCDCSGLVVWAAEQLGKSIYHGSDTQWREYCAEKGKLKHGMREDGQILKRGTLLFIERNGKREHVGVYMGNGLAAEARGTQWGVILDGAERFNEWGEMKGLDYSREGSFDRWQTLKRGSEGYAVLELQRRLNEEGFACGREDGLFGERTESALLALQRAEGLEPDGVCGERTRSALADRARRTGETAENAETETAEDADALLDRAQALIREARALLGNGGL